jgi:hypothetical protein
MTAGNRSVELVLTLSVNNTSTRARVEYDSIYIDVGNSPAPTSPRHKKASRGCGRPPFEGSTRQPYRSRRRGVTGLAPAVPHSPPTVVGMGSLLGSWCGGTGVCAPDA